MKRAVALALLCAVAVPAPAAASQPPPRPTIQQQFDAAQAAMDARNWPEALRILDALEPRARNNPRTLALIRVRRGVALVPLSRLDEAAAAIRLGLPALPADDATLVGDRFLAMINLAMIAEHRLDYPEALRLYRLASALPVRDMDRLSLQRGIIQTQLFTDVEAALRDADAALRLAASVAPGDRALAGAFHTLKGRALLNLHRYPEARHELEEAMRLLGDLTNRVDRADLLARSDLAIAALLAGDAEAARRYLAYTGAGLFGRGSFRFVSREWPRCGATLAPDDVAVVELVVAENGVVTDARPVYASRQGPSAIEFARAAGRWTFDADQLRNIALLFRTVVRLEIRCSQRRPSVSLTRDQGDFERLVAAYPDWGGVIAESRNLPAGALRTELAALETTANPDRRGVVQLLILLASRPELAKAERQSLRRRALTLAAAASVPPELIADIALAIRSEQQERGRDRAGPLSTHEAILALPEVAGSPRAVAYVRLDRAEDSYQDGNYGEALADTALVRAMPGLGAGDPLRTRALEIEVAVQAARGNHEAARAAYEAIGPEASRCGLAPRQLPVTTTSGDFPDEALRWGFEGFAENEQEAGEDGRVVGTRTLIAYPPFVFGEAARRLSARSRFAPNYVGGGGTCPAGSQTVHFRLPAG